MKQKIFKYQIDDLPAAPGTRWLKLPKGAVALSVGEQGEALVMWALVDPEAPSVPQAIGVYYTGSDLPEETGFFIGTVQDRLGLVYHVFDNFEQIPKVN